MSIDNKISNRKKYKVRLSCAKIAKWSFLAMVVSFFFSPVVFFVMLLVFAVSFGLGLEDIIKKSDSVFPWWWGGL